MNVFNLLEDTTWNPDGSLLRIGNETTDEFYRWLYKDEFASGRDPVSMYLVCIQNFMMQQLEIRRYTLGENFARIGAPYKETTELARRQCAFTRYFEIDEINTASFEPVIAPLGCCVVTDKEASTSPEALRLIREKTRKGSEVLFLTPASTQGSISLLQDEFKNALKAAHAVIPSRDISIHLFKVDS